MLDHLLHPVSPEAFFRDHWDKKPLHIPGAAGKLAGIYDARRWHRRWLGDARAATADERGVQLEVPIDARLAHPLFLLGMTVCGDVTPDPDLAPFLRAFRRAFALPGGAAFARLYASREGSGFQLHTDRFHVFVLQLLGKKRWWVSPVPALAHADEGAALDGDGQPVVWTGPDKGQRFLADDGRPLPPPDRDTFDSFLLEEGHCLYLPPGTWHTARALGESVAISISPPRVPAAEIFARVLQALLRRRPAWRQDVIAAFDEQPPAGEIPRSVSSVLDARLGELRDLLRDLGPDALHRVWLESKAPSSQ